jgi:transposase
MRPLTLSDPTIVLSLQDEIRRSPEARYDHRLHGLLMIAHGVSCPEVAAILGDAPRTVQYWVHRFEEDGLQGLAEHDRPGRPARLSVVQRAHLERVLRQPPSAAGFAGAIWDGKTLAAYVQRRFDLTLGVRQCQRLFRHWGFRLRKPRPVIAQADPERHEAAKKNSRRS